MIHAIKRDGRVEIWTDTEADVCDGRCLGSGRNLTEARQVALQELVLDMQSLAMLTVSDIRKNVRSAS